MTPTAKVGVLPRFGYGTWNHLGDEAYHGVLWALEAGYRHIDTAEGYRNEEEVGRAIADSGVARADIFLVTKVSPESLAPGQVMGHAKDSLRKLGVAQVDLYLIHWPAIGDRYGIADYMKQISEVQDAGLAKHIGVANFTKRHIDAALKIIAPKRLATNQVEIHALMQNRPVVDHCRALGIPMTAYSPLARGAVGQSAVLRRIGGLHGASAEQAALAFLLAEGHVVIPSSARKERIVSNFKADSVVLTADEVAEIRGLDEGRRVVNGAWCPAWDA